MAEFTIQARGRVCAASGQPLAPGDGFVAALTVGETGLVRTDYAAGAWAGPPAGCVAYWPGRVRLETRKIRPLSYSETTLAEWFQHLAGNEDPAQANLRYVVALLLMRKKRLKFEGTRSPDSQPAVLVVRDVKTGVRHEVPDPKPTPDELAAVEAEIGRELGWD